MTKAEAIRTRATRTWPAVGLLTIAVFAACGARKQPAGPLRTIGQIMRAREAEIASGQRVELRGVVTLLDPGWRLMAIQDEEGGVLVEWLPQSASLHVGERVEITGATSLDNHVPSIVGASLRSAIPGALPPAKAASADSIACGSDLYRRVEVEFSPDKAALGDDLHSAEFSVAASCGRLEIIGRVLLGYSPVAMEGQRLRVRGVPVASYSPSGALDHVRLMFDDQTDLDVLGSGAPASQASAADASGLPLIRSIRAVKEMPRTEAERGYPALVEGVVTALNPRHTGYFIQDGPTAICVFFQGALEATPKPGQRVRLSGVTEKGGFAPLIRQTSVTALGKAALPEPARLQPGDVFHGWEENIWAEVEGTAAAVTREGDMFQLELFSGPRRLLVWFGEGGEPERLQPLINARLSVRGVYSPLYSAAGSLLGFRVYTSSPETLTQIHPPEIEVLFRTIASLSQFDLRGAPQRRFRTTGVVTYHDSRGRLFLQDGDSALRVVGNGQADPEPGTRAEVVGFLSPDAPTPQMEHVKWESVQQTAPVAPASKLAESLLSGEFDGRLVTVEGFLESRRSSGGDLQLSLLAGRSRFGASMEAPGSAGQFPSLRPGALLRLTGVCATQPLEGSSGTRQATLLLRSARDIAVLRPAPWWDVRRAAYGAFAISGLLVCALIVAVRLRQNLVAQIAVRSELEQRLLHSQKLESVGRLAGGVAHDFNNLLTVINGYSHLLLDRVEAKGPLRAGLEEIRAAGQRAAELTQKLLTFSRKQLSNPKVLDPNVVVREAAKMFERVIGEDIELTTSLDPSLGRVMADPGQLHQALVNLVVNARDAMPQGGRLTIETKNVLADDGLARQVPGMPPGAYVRIGISDTGAGMTDEVKSHLFEPFFTTKGSLGTGLGLATVHGIVKQGGGWIRVTSELGKGAAVDVYLPAIEAGEAALPAPGEGGAATPGTETVLVIEDQEAVRKFLVAVLRKNGYRVLEAADGAAAIALAAEFPEFIHLLVTDVVLPRMSGRAAAEELKTARPAMKVLYVSGYPEDAIGRHGMLESGLHYLPKPFTPEQLAAKAREVLAV